MELREFLDTQSLTYPEYQNIRAHLSHISSFALWLAKHTGNQAPALLVDTEADFNAQLAGKLHKNVVILGLNYGDVKGSEKTIAQQIAMQPDERVTLYQSHMNMANQYGGRYGKKGLGPKFSYYQATDSLIRGAYLTDLFKYSLDEHTDLIASGLPSHTWNEFEKSHSQAEMAEILAFNIDGLAYELEQIVGLDTSKPFVILLMGKSKFANSQAAIQAKFPTAIIEIIYHYQARKKTIEMEARNSAVIDKVGIKAV